MSDAPSGPTLSGEVIADYRTLPARIIGWSMVAGAVVLATLTVIDVSMGRDEGLLFPVALICGIAAVSWALFLRPRVRLRTDGVELDNVVTDTVVPFGAVAEVTHRWALELHDGEGRRHSAWAVPVRRERSRRRALDDFAETTRRRGSAGTTAQGVADEVQRALQRWRLDGGQLGDHDASATRAVQTVSWPAVTALSVAVVLSVLAVLA
jgi:hypothetical protein